MRAIILALSSSERDEKKDKEGEKRAKSDVDAMLLFKPLLQYAIESVQKCPSHLVTSCAVCVTTKEDAKFAKALCEKMTTTTYNASSSSVPSSSSSNESAVTTLHATTTTEKKMTFFEVLEVEGDGGDANALR